MALLGQLTVEPCKDSTPKALSVNCLILAASKRSEGYLLARKALQIENLSI